MGNVPTITLPERQNKAKSPAFQATDWLFFVSTGNASLACGYENQAFQAFCKKYLYPKLRFKQILIQMKKIFFSILIAVCLIACSDRMPRHTGDFPIIDVIGNVGNFQRVYMSEFFSSIELIPLETGTEFLLDSPTFPVVVMNETVIIMRGNHQLFAFDRSTGKFLHPIGRRGQGPGEYNWPGTPFFNADKSTVFVHDISPSRIIEFDINNGRHIRTISVPDIEGRLLEPVAQVADNLFIGTRAHTGNYKYKHHLFDDTGTIVKRFPNHIFFNMPRERASTFHLSLNPMRIDDRLYLKDFVNDTIYVFRDFEIQPAYVFDFGRFGYPIERLGDAPSSLPYTDLFILRCMVGTSRFFFYRVRIPDRFPRPRARPISSPIIGTREPSDVFGIFDKVQNRTILLDSDQHLQQGFVNDINGGLSFIPRFYAGNGEVVGVWNPEDMMELLTEEYFATKTIRDPEGHQRLREVLRNLVWDDNPVIVIATLKQN